MLEDANAQIMIEASFEASGCEGANGDESVRGRVDDGEGTDDRAEVGKVGALKGGVVTECYGDRVRPRGLMEAELSDGLRICD